MRRFYFVFVAAAVAILPFALQADTIVEEIVARVNSQIITKSQYQHEQQQLKDECDRQDPSHPDQACEAGGKDVLRGLIDRQLLLEKGKELGITADTEIIKRLDEIRKEMKLDSLDDLEKAAASQGVSFEDYKQNMKNEIITQEVIQKEVGPHINIGREEEHKFYDQHKAEMSHAEGIRLSEILVSTDDAGDDQQKLDADKAKAEDLLKQIKAGANFEDFAKKYSQDQSGAQGGDLGYFERGKLAKQLEDVTFAMKKGDISDVIRTKQGFVILKVTDHQAAGTPTFDEAEPRIQEAVYMQKMQPALRDYLKKLREQAYIDVRPGYVDTGASPNETKPVVTAAAKEANSKELKKKKRIGLF